MIKKSYCSIRLHLLIGNLKILLKFKMKMIIRIRDKITRKVVSEKSS